MVVSVLTNGPSSVCIIVLTVFLSLLVTTSTVPTFPSESFGSSSNLDWNFALVAFFSALFATFSLSVLKASPIASIARHVPISGSVKKVPISHT